MMNELQVDTATGWLNWLTFGWFGDEEANDPYVGDEDGPWWLSGAANTADSAEVAEEAAETVALETTEEAAPSTEWDWEWPTSGEASPTATPWIHAESDSDAFESIANTEDADAVAYVFHVDIL